MARGVLDGVNVPTNWLRDFIYEHDPKAKESVGFLISPRYGLSIDLDHSERISVFVTGRWDRFLT
jgi:hypothetical protein